MAGRIELSFLYQTRTILRLPKRAPIPGRRFTTTKHGAPLSSEEHPFLRAKAPEVTWSPLAPKSHAKTSSTTISSTITASERRAFETILRFAPKQTEPLSTKRRSPYTEAVDVDIDNIVKIFTSSVRSHQTDQDGKIIAKAGDREPRVEPPKLQVSEDQATPPFSTAAWPKSPFNQQSSFQFMERAGILSTEQAKPRPTEQPELQTSMLSDTLKPGQQTAKPLRHPQVGPNPTEAAAEQPAGHQRVHAKAEEHNEPHIWAPFVLGPKSKEDPFQWPTPNADSPIDRTEPEASIEPGKNATLASEATEESMTDIRPTSSTTPASDALSSGVPEPVEKEEVTLPEKSLSETAIPSHSRDKMDTAIQSTVREKMHSISSALQAAAVSTANRGDIAMWEVVETQIFSMAKDLQPQTAQISEKQKRHQVFQKLGKLTYTGEKSSENPHQMIEAAERELRVGSAFAPVTTAIGTEYPEKPHPQRDLLILQNTYPAALLLALRLYIAHFPASPYPLLLLPRIRSLGTTSYVLGASPQFYNSLISLVWVVRSNLREVDGLLGEMELGGVEMNEGTYAILGGIEEERAADLEREKKVELDTEEVEMRGSRGASWWKRQEQMLWFPRVLDWLDVIAGRLAAKERLSVS